VQDAHADVVAVAAAARQAAQHQPRKQAAQGRIRGAGLSTREKRGESRQQLGRLRLAKLDTKNRGSHYKAAKCEHFHQGPALWAMRCASVFCTCAMSLLW
jgi:hypothetical protein